MRALLVLAFLFSFGAEAQDVPLQTRVLAGDAVKAHTAWVQQMSAKGASLRIKEVQRKGNVIQAQFYAEGLPKKWIYNLMSFPIGSKNASILLSGVTLDESGRAICSGRPGECGKEGRPNAPVSMFLEPANGEPLRFALVARTDQTVRAAFNYVPFPIASTDKSCKAEAVLLEPGAGLVRIEGSGFPLNATVTLASEGNGKSAQKPLKSNAKGEVNTMVMPNREAGKQGTVRVQLSSPACAPAISVPWSLKKR